MTTCKRRVPHEPAVTPGKSWSTLVKTQSFLTAAKPGAEAPLEWVVLNGRDEQDRKWLATQSELDEAIKPLVSDPPTHSERVHHGSAMVLTLVRSADVAGEVLLGLSVVIEPSRVVTVCYGTDAIVDEAVARQAGGGLPASTSRVLALLVTALVKPLEPEITRLADRIDALEDAAMKESDDRMDDAVVLLGRQALHLRRYLAPMHDELSYLALNPDELPGPAEPKYLRRAAESPARLVSALDSSHRRVLLVLDQLGRRDGSRLERSIQKLTLVATVFLPLTFITGLLGVNVPGIPGAHNPFAFWVLCLILVGVAVAAVFLIRRRKWM
jgi:zinc transporter